MKSQSSIVLISLLLPALALAAEQSHSRATVPAAAAAAAPKGGCVALTATVEREKSVAAADGSVTKQYEPTTHVVPGTEVVWATTAHNNCSKPAEHVVINQRVPEHMVFVADSAIGGGAQITLSVDGKDFVPAAQLTARNADGSSRAARATDVRFVRWTLAGAIAPHNEFAARFRAVLQ